jgi:6-phosphogluconolactonase
LPTIVDGYHIGSDGTLTPVTGSPFMPGVGINSNVVVLSPDDKTLFVSNQFSHSVTAFHVAQDGSLSLVPGSPFFLRASGFAVGMATSQDGKFLYVVNNSPPMVAVFQVGGNGTLTEVAGSPFPTGVSSFFNNLLALTAFPPKSCSLTTTVDNCDQTAGSSAGGHST